MSDELQCQLDRVVQMAAKQDQIVWTVFGVFAAANALLLNTLFVAGKTTDASVGVIVSVAGVLLSVLWLWIQSRAIDWLKYYENILQRLEEELGVRADLAISSHLNTVTRQEAVHGWSTRTPMWGTSAVSTVSWGMSSIFFLCRIAGTQWDPRTVMEAPAMTLILTGVSIVVGGLVGWLIAHSYSRKQIAQANAAGAEARRMAGGLARLIEELSQSLGTHKTFTLGRDEKGDIRWEVLNQTISVTAARLHLTIPDPTVTVGPPRQEPPSAPSS